MSMLLQHTMMAHGMCGTCGSEHDTVKWDQWKTDGVKNEVAHFELMSDIVIAATRTVAILHQASTLTSHLLLQPYDCPTIFVSDVCSAYLV